MALLWRVIFSTWSTHLIKTTVLSDMTSCIYRQVSIYTSTYNIYPRSSSCFLIFVVFFLLFLYYHSSPSPFLPTSSWSTSSCSFDTCKWIRSHSLQVSSVAPFHVPAICTLTWFLLSHEMFPNIHKLQISASCYRKKYTSLTMYNVRRRHSDTPDTRDVILTWSNHPGCPYSFSSHTFSHREN